MADTKTSFLDKLIPEFGNCKHEADRLKKESDNYNKQIKEIMKDLPEKLWNYEAGGWVANYSTQTRSSMDEEKLIQFLKSKKLAKGIVKKKDYIDEKALENAIYNGAISDDIVLEMESCKNTTIVPILKVSKKKGDK